MSAYMVDREHIAYLLEAAMSYRLFGRHGGGMHWYHDGKSGELRSGAWDEAARVGQMLWDANRRSIEARYPDTLENFRDNAPGPVGETFEYERHRGLPGVEIDPVQVLKACHCFAYQACEYDGWKDSEAKAWIDSLAATACRCVDGYENAEWGAPKSAYSMV